MTEQLTKPEQDENRQFSDEAAAENLALYLNDIGLEQPLDTVSQHHKRIMADLPLMVQLDSLPAPERPKTDRDRMVAYFEEKNWLPKQQREATIAALNGVDETLRRAGKADNPENALLATHANVKRYYENALDDSKTLNAVKAPTDKLTIEVNLKKLRTDRPALYVMADNLMAREFLDNASWPNSNWTQYKDRQNYWRGFMLFAAAYAGDEVLGSAFNHIFEKTTERRHHWSKQYSYVKSKVGHLAVRDIAPPLGSVEKTEEGETEDAPPAEESALEDGTESIFEAMMLPADREQMAARQEAYSARFDELQPQGMPEAEKQAILQREFPEFTSAQELDYQEVRQLMTDRSKQPPAEPRTKPNPANSPAVRSQVGYDKRPDKY